MSNLEDNIFTFPIDDEIQLPDYDGDICVVGLIGKSSYNPSFNKASYVNSVIDRQVFSEASKIYTSTDKVQEKYELEAFYSRSEKLLILNLRTALDTNDLIAQSEKLLNIVTDKKEPLNPASNEYIYARLLVYIFSVCHIIVIFEPSCTFDITYVRLFRILDSVRRKLADDIGDKLYNIRAGKEWEDAGRPCSPRVLFCFQSRLAVETLKHSRAKNHAPLKKLTHAIEDQIYAILRKARIITNISNYSLFAVPANEAFVYIQPKTVDQSEQPIEDPVDFYLSKLVNHCAISKEDSLNDDQQEDFKPFAVQTGEFFKSNYLPSPEKPRNFCSFLRPHIELAHSKGFDDNIGKNRIPAVFEMAPIRKTLQICSELYDLILYDVYKPTRYEMKSFRAHIEVDKTFSESRCNKLKNRAESFYREGLPSHYRLHDHLNQLSKAKATFLEQARGAAAEKHLQRLEEDCYKYWTSGHQLCEELSLKNNPCVHPLHIIPGVTTTEETKHLKVQSHNSKIYTKAACNCGKEIIERRDPFTHKAGNYTFYNDITCCNQLEAYELPVFKPSTSESRARQTFKSIKEQLQSSVQRSRMDSLRSDKTDPFMSTVSSELNSQHSSQSDLYNCDIQELDSMPIDDPAIVAMNTEQVEKEHSTIEYLSGMTHSESATDLLPEFSSWSLLKLMPYTRYNHSQGLDQPGFLSRNGFFLPYEFTVTIERPATSEKKGKQRKSYKESEERTQNVMLYVGYEYECPRGHRFMASILDKPNKPSSLQNVTTLLNDDLPLYAPCSCRKTMIAQLMRVFFAVPPGPLEVSVRPQVRPHPAPCPIFHMGTTEPIQLLNNYVSVLRLPYIYLGDSGPYALPKGQTAFTDCLILKNSFTVKHL